MRMDWFLLTSHSGALTNPGYLRLGPQMIWQLPLSVYSFVALDVYDCGRAFLTGRCAVTRTRDQCCVVRRTARKAVLQSLSANAPHPSPAPGRAGGTCDTASLRPVRHRALLTWLPDLTCLSPSLHLSCTCSHPRYYHLSLGQLSSTLAPIIRWLPYSEGGVFKT